MTLPQPEAVEPLECQECRQRHGHVVAGKAGDPHVCRRDGGGYHVLCFQCSASSGTYRSEAEAIAAWNRRAPPPAADHEAEIAALKLSKLKGEFPSGAPIYTGYEIDEAIDRAATIMRRAALPVASIDALKTMIASAITEEASESLQYVLIRGLSTMGYSQPTMESHNLIEAAAVAVMRQSSSPKDT